MTKPIKCKTHACPRARKENDEARAEKKDREEKQDSKKRRMGKERTRTTMIDDDLVKE